MKTLSDRTLLIAVLAGSVFSLIFIISYLSLKSRERAGMIPLAVNTAVLDKQESTGSSLPVRLKIPKINVIATIDPIGITNKGMMEVPSGTRNVGWFSLGPHPGEVGSAVIDGHYGRWENGDGSVFDDLGKLEKGDSVYVEDEKGVITTFIVRQSRIYDPHADATGVFNSDDGQEHLNLITCEGIWSGVAKGYSGRLVVFTDKE